MIIMLTNICSLFQGCPIVDKFSLPVGIDPSKIITDEMLEVEKSLEIKGQEDEESRQETNKKVDCFDRRMYLVVARKEALLSKIYAFTYTLFSNKKSALLLNCLSPELLTTKKCIFI